MTLTLARHSFPDDPTWIIVSTSVPIGTDYEVIGGPDNFIIQDLLTGRSRNVACYHVRGNGGVGWIPAIVFGD